MGLESAYEKVPCHPFPSRHSMPLQRRGKYKDRGGRREDISSMPELASTSFPRPCRENPVRIVCPLVGQMPSDTFPPLCRRRGKGEQQNRIFPPSVHRRIRGDMPPNPTLWLMINNSQQIERASICILPLLLNPNVFLGSLYRRLLRGRADRHTHSEYE